MAKKSVLRLGIIGAGLMGRTHAAAAREIARRGLLGVRVEAIADTDHARGIELARKHDCRYFETGGALIADPDVDAVVVAVPTAGHLPLAEATAEAGKPLFLEKPIGRNLAEAERIAKAVERAGIACQIGLVLRFSPTYNVLKALCRQKSNGPLVFCRFRDDQDFPANERYGSAWRADAEVAGGGALLEHSIHDVDVLHWLFGAPKLEGAMFSASHAPGIEAVAALDLRFPEGGAAQLASVWHRNGSRENERHVEIFFERRYFRTKGGFVSPIFVQGPEGPERKIDKEEVEKRFRKMIRWSDSKNADFPATAARQMLAFLEAVRGGSGAASPGLAEGLAAHRLIEKAYRARKKAEGKR